MIFIKEEIGGRSSEPLWSVQSLNSFIELMLYIYSTKFLVIRTTLYKEKNFTSFSPYSTILFLR